MHIVAHDKGKPAVRRGRKTTGPGMISGQRGYRSEQGLQVYKNPKRRARQFGPRIRSLQERLPSVDGASGAK